MSLSPLFERSITASAFLESISPLGVLGKALICLNERPFARPFGSFENGTPHPIAPMLQDKVLPMDSQVWRFSPTSSENYAAKQNHQ